MKLKNCLILGFGSMGERHLRSLKKFKFNQIDIVDKSSKRLNIANKKININTKYRWA